MDLTTGLGAAVGEVGGGAIITAIAVAPVPEPTAALLALLGVSAAGVSRRSQR